MRWYDISGDQPLFPLWAAGPKGAPPAIPPIIINPFRYQVPGPAIDPRTPPPSPPITPPSAPALSLRALPA